MILGGKNCPKILVYATRKHDPCQDFCFLVEWLVLSTNSSCAPHIIQEGRAKNVMKKDIHPTYTIAAAVSCVCGATMTTGSTQKELKTEICSQCHPFYTGKKKFVDSTGRVDRFKKLSEKSLAAKKTLRATPKVRKSNDKKAA
jgi:large subunit ribosomal protein L31